MILTKILFLILILVCAAFYILYIWDFALVLLVVMTALPIVMFIIAFSSKKFIKIQFNTENSPVFKNKQFPVSLSVQNRSFFPVGKAEAHIEYFNSFSSQTNSFDLFIPIQARNTQKVTFNMSSKFCGVITIKLSHILIFDPLRIFKFRIGKNIVVQIPIIPEIHEIGGTICTAERNDVESSVYSENFPGDDPSEVFDLREYSPGDKLNRIHWKLSSKKDDFIVKDYSLPIDIPSLIFIDLNINEDPELILPIFDTLADTLLSLSQFMLENERFHKVVYFSRKYQKFVETTISSDEDLAALSRAFILSLNDSPTCQSAEAYLNENPLSLASFTLISSSCDNKTLSCIDENVDADIKNALIAVKNPNETETSSVGYSEVNIIPVVIGRISSSVKDIEL